MIVVEQKSLLVVCNLHLSSKFELTLLCLYYFNISSLCSQLYPWMWGPLTSLLPVAANRFMRWIYCLQALMVWSLINSLIWLKSRSQQDGIPSPAPGWIHPLNFLPSRKFYQKFPHCWPLWPLYQWHHSDLFLCGNSFSDIGTPSCFRKSTVIIQDLLGEPRANSSS